MPVSPKPAGISIILENFKTLGLYRFLRDLVLMPKAKHTSTDSGGDQKCARQKTFDIH